MDVRFEKTNEIIKRNLETITGGLEEMLRDFYIETGLMVDLEVEHKYSNDKLIHVVIASACSPLRGSPINWDETVDTVDNKSNDVWLCKGCGKSLIGIIPVTVAGQKAVKLEIAGSYCSGDCIGKLQTRRPEVNRYD